ncbi:Bestrophin, RFP-TM, chloride channel [Sporomusa ovata DSM 2662]|uniref:Uncharacterized protein n=2 Tax=Sporomusa ovata TaxID=2378 RepID=A0A0U1KRB2_9FIRM|nr:bestrophin family ion channel [Sporomusa ovata]EQB27603.1 hypothetical protein SOV_2c05000 [Sporomusa ovata DSM 2662]CQR69956.1 hypothetical protein SpAn4DRAFT_4821 [Sporomusa ovata]
MIFKRGSLIRHALYHSILYSIIATIVVGIDLCWFEIKFSTTPWAIVGGALGLLLVFRTNTAYDRYWEGRKAIGEISITLRSLTTLIVNTTKDADKKKKWVILLKLFMFAVNNRLQMRKIDFLNNNKEYLDINEILLLRDSDNQPLSLILIYKKNLVEQVNCGDLDNILFVHIDSLFNILIKTVGICERIKNTPIPFPYHIHIKSLLVLFCITLPVALVDSMGGASIIACAFITFAFVGIEEIGIEIEDPFGGDTNDFNLDEYATNIEMDIVKLYEC